MCGMGKILVNKPGHGGPFTNPILVTPQLKACILVSMSMLLLIIVL